MTGLVTLGQQPGMVAQLPVSIDYPAALALRQMALVQDEPAEIPAGTGSQRPAPLCARSAPQDAAGNPLEHRRAHLTRRWR